MEVTGIDVTYNSGVVNMENMGNRYGYIITDTLPAGHYKVKVVAKDDMGFQDEAECQG